MKGNKSGEKGFIENRRSIPNNYNPAETKIRLHPNLNPASYIIGKLVLLNNC